MRTTIVVTLLLLAPLTLTNASAELASHTSLRLVVVDQTHAVLPHAAVSIYTLDGTAGVRAIADENGVVYLPAIAAGATQIVASYPGFSPSLEQTTLRAGDNARSVMLLIAPVVETVTVVGSLARTIPRS